MPADEWRVIYKFKIFSYVHVHQLRLRQLLLLHYHYLFHEEIVFRRYYIKIDDGGFLWHGLLILHMYQIFYHLLRIEIFNGKNPQIY
jgi:hypothetical protein